MIVIRLSVPIILLLLPLVARAQLVGDLIHDAVELETARTSEQGKTVLWSYASVAIDSAFTGVALQGLTSSDTLHGSVRLEDGGQWGEWQTLYIVRSATDEAFLAAWRSVEVQRASRFELRFAVDTGHEVTILLAGTFDARKDAPNTEAPQQGDTYQSGDVITAPRLYTRRDWGAEPFRGTPIALNRPDYRFMTLHHTAGFGAVTLAQGLDQVKRIQDFHQNGRGWSDIGYQFLMDQEGRLYQGRPFLNRSVPFSLGPPLAHGAHVGGANTGNIGVSLMGCYHPPEGGNCRDAMTPAAIDSLLVTFAFLAERYGVSPQLMRGHRDFSSTACPGDNNYVQLPSFREQIAELLTTGNAPLGQAAMHARTDSTGVVVVRWAFLEDLGIEEYSVMRKMGEQVVTLTTSDEVADGRIADLASAGHNEYLLVARGNRNREQILASVEIDVHNPGRYVLAQSFPNPASREAVIRYYLPAPGVVTLRIYDVNGREVSRLEESYREEEQWHTTVLDTSSLPSGVYYYQLHLEGFVETLHRDASPLVVIR
ncbi:MAG: N-acetylmuramoyl-L-alanine amidase [Bacteroidota bacterium]|nr:N-acetylmuramoyl-L-alanine amidase [Bacteroidota bacterium]